MTLCRGYALVKGRPHRHAQKCAAIPDGPDGYCVVHAKAAGYRRCPSGHWIPLGRTVCEDCPKDEATR